MWLYLSSSARQRKCGGSHPRDGQSKGNVWFLLSCTRRPSLHLPFLHFFRRSRPPGAIGKPPTSAALVPAWQGFMCCHLNASLDPDGAELGWVRRHQPRQKSATFPCGHPGTPCRREGTRAQDIPRFPSVPKANYFKTWQLAPSPLGVENEQRRSSAPWRLRGNLNGISPG